MVAVALAALVAATGAATAVVVKPAKPGRFACSVKQFRVLNNPDTDTAGIVDARSRGLVGTDPSEGVGKQCRKLTTQPATGTASESHDGLAILSCSSPSQIQVSVSVVRRGGRAVGSLLVVTAGTSSRPIATAYAALTKAGTSTTTWDARRCQLLSGVEEPQDEATG